MKIPMNITIIAMKAKTPLAGESDEMIVAASKATSNPIITKSLKASRRRRLDDLTEEFLQTVHGVNGSWNQKLASRMFGHLATRPVAKIFRGGALGQQHFPLHY
jgi:hypothetical protein